jgi:hypothetical protein
MIGTIQSTSTMSLGPSGERTPITTQKQEESGTVFVTWEHKSGVAAAVWRRYAGRCVLASSKPSLHEFGWKSVATVETADDVKLAELCDALTSVKLGEEVDCLPSEYAYFTAARVLAEAYGLLGVAFSGYFRIPAPIMLADDEGALRVRWMNRDRELRANFGASPQHRSYLYFEDGGNYGLENLSGEVLAERLRRLVEG